MACVGRRKRSLVASCPTCRTVQRREQSHGCACMKQCVQVVGCCSRRRARARHRQEEDEEERPTAGGGTVLEEGQPPPTEPRLMRCRAVRRNWNLDDLCKEMGVA